MRQGDRACGDNNGDEAMHGFEVFVLPGIRCEEEEKEEYGNEGEFCRFQTNDEACMIGM